MGNAFKPLLIVATIAWAQAAYAARAPVFEVTASRTKIGDTRNSFGWNDGFHNLIRSGEDLFMVYLDDTGFAYVSGVSTGREVEVRIARSRDGGTTWDGSMIVARSPSIEIDGAAIAIGPDLRGSGGRRLHVAWADNHTVNYSSIAIDVANALFVDPVTVSGSVYVTQYTTTMQADASGGVSLFFSGSESAAAGVYSSWSQDGGMTFSGQGVLLATGSPNAIVSSAVDTAGSLFLTWDSGGSQYYSRKQFGGSWADATVIPGGGGPSSIAALDANNVYVSVECATGIMVHATATGGLSSSDWTSTVASQEGVDSSIGVAGDGTVTIAWTAGNNPRSIALARSFDRGVTFSAPTVAVTGRDALYWPNLAISASGKAMFAFDDGEGVYFTRER